MMTGFNPHIPKFGARYSVRAKGPGIDTATTIISGATSLMDPHSQLLGSSSLATGISSLIQTPVEVTEIKDPQ